VKKTQITEFKQKIKQMDQIVTSNIDELKNIITDIKIKHDVNVISYFTYSLDISHNKEQENLLIGTYHIRNLGNKPITNPYICIKLPQNSPFTFSGKIINNKNKILMSAPGAWERINDEASSQEFWLKPITVQLLPPSEGITFQNFQLKWIALDSYSGNIMGFTYCDEFKDGKPAINQISISGNINS
jgi:hypothetical protein